ncbi:MAG: S8 family serine peptidase, partial [Nonlabens sp.]
MRFIISISVFLFFLSSANAQTVEEIENIKKGSNRNELLAISKEYSADYSPLELKTIAREKNWEYVISENHQFSQLVGITKDDRPIYYTTYNFGAGQTSRAHALNTGGSLNLDINGQNMRAGVWDGGSARSTHEIFTNRVQVMDGGSINDHATHVVGTVIGDNTVENGNAQGMSYMASVDSYDWTSDISEVSLAASNGLLLSNHSYGYNPAFLNLDQYGKYDEDSRAFDAIMYNAPYYQQVVAAGNTRDDGINTGKIGYDLITGMALAKNGITVAAVNGVSNYQNPSDVVMSSFSSWGPADDGRIKPDISAKGVNVFSSTSASDSSYSVYSGTSMASPSATGTLLLMQQYYNSLYGSYMKAATLKALMIHTADEAGSFPGPDYKFGWGLINAEAAAEVIEDKDVLSVMEENTLDNGGQFNRTYRASGTEPVMVTITWSDPAATPVGNNLVDDATPMLVNDLDVVVINNGVTYHPWKLDVSSVSSPATTGDNTVDNVEKIEIPNATGSIQVIVTHKGNLVNLSQDYSIVVTGVSANDFWFTVNDQSDLELCNSTNSAQIDLDSFRAPTFTGNVNLNALNLPSGLSASFSPNLLSNQSSFNLNLSGINNVASGSYDVIISGQSGSSIYNLPLTLNIYGLSNLSVALVSPMNNDTDVDVETEFNWQLDPNASSYRLQVASDPNFSNLIVNELLIHNSYEDAQLAYQTQYYWRVLNSNPCGNGAYSQTYSFTTNCDNPIDLLLLSATSSTVDLFISDNNSSQWEIEVVLQGATPSGNGILYNSSTSSIYNLLSSTCYNFYVRSVCGSGFSVWSGPFTFCTSADYCAGDRFYDSGGASGSYFNNEDWTETIYPETSGERIRAIFQSFRLEGCCDYLEIYDGPTTSDQRIFRGNGFNSPGEVFSTHSSGALTFRFTSDSSVVYSGWEASIICEPKPACSNLPSDLGIFSATSSSITIDWTENGSSTSWEVEIVPQGTTPTGSGIITTSNPFTFNNLSPQSFYDVYVRAICAAGNSGWVSGTFETTCGAIQAPVFEPFSASGSTPNCWAESGSENWMFSTGAGYAASFAGDFTSNGNTNYAWIDGSVPNGPGQTSTLTTLPIDISNLNV